MDTNRIKEIQLTTAFPDSISVQHALLQVWNECEIEKKLNNILVRQNCFFEAYHKRQELNIEEFDKWLQSKIVPEKLTEEKVKSYGFEYVEETIKTEKRIIALPCDYIKHHKSGKINQAFVLHAAEDYFFVSLNDFFIPVHFDHQLKTLYYSIYNEKL